MVDFKEILELILSSPRPLHKSSHSEFSKSVLISHKKFNDRSKRKKEAFSDDLENTGGEKFKLSEKQIQALNVSLTIKILSIAEGLYAREREKGLPSYTSKDSGSFWDHLKKELYSLMHQAFDIISDKTFILPKKLQMSLLTSQENTLTENCEKIMSSIFFTLEINKFCKDQECVFLRRFDQKNQPQYHLQGPQCIGVVFDWAYRLWVHPPVQPAEPSKKLKDYLEFISILSKEEFPLKFFAQETLLGEPCLNKTTHFFQEQRCKLLDIAGPPEVDSYKFSGTILMKDALQLFEKRAGTRKKKTIVTGTRKFLETSNIAHVQNIPSVSIIEATLIRNISSDMPHMVGIAKIQRKDSTVYRFVDSEVGEFEASCPKKLGIWLQQYFKLFDYTKMFSGFTLRVIDPTLKGLSRILSDFNKTHEQVDFLMQKTQDLALKPKPAMIISYKKQGQKSSSFSGTYDSKASSASRVSKTETSTSGSYKAKVIISDVENDSSATLNKTEVKSGSTKLR